jgi:hypothetical protein
MPPWHTPPNSWSAEDRNLAWRSTPRGDRTLAVGDYQIRVKKRLGQTVRNMRVALPVLHRIGAAEQGVADERVEAINSSALPMLMFVGREKAPVRRRGSSEGRNERLPAR